MSEITREKAFTILKRYTKTERLIRHALSVEAATRRFAGKFGEDVEKWGIIGLLHDVDYEMYPDEHCMRTQQLLEPEGFPLDWIRSIRSHGWDIMPGVEIEPSHRMEWVLYTVDQLTGLITAAALMRPSRSVLDIEVRSVKKKWKDKAFAAGVDRAVIQLGADKLGMELGDVIAETIEGMRAAAVELDLAGTAPLPTSSAIAEQRTE